MPHLQKSNPYIALVSTPGRIGSLMHRISQESIETCMWKRIYIPYTDALEAGMFSEQEIALAKMQPAFEREFNLQWGYGVEGSCFNPV